MNASLEQRAQLISEVHLGIIQRSVPLVRRLGVLARRGVKADLAVTELDGRPDDDPGIVEIEALNRVGRTNLVDGVGLLGPRRFLLDSGGARMDETVVPGMTEPRRACGVGSLLKALPVILGKPHLP